jgi:hypothetical protein
MGCAEPPPAAAPAAPNPTCSAVFPEGLWKPDWAAISLPPHFAISVTLDSEYTFKDPGLAHDVFPGAFLKALNDHVAAGKPGWRTSDEPIFRLADGIVAPIQFKITATADATGDHYGVSVVVIGPTVPRSQWSSNTPLGPIFSYRLDNLYITSDKLTADAARKANDFLFKGWSCESGVAKENRPGTSPWEGARQQ